MITFEVGSNFQGKKQKRLPWKVQSSTSHDSNSSSELRFYCQCPRRCHSGHLFYSLKHDSGIWLRLHLGSLEPHLAYLTCADSTTWFRGVTGKGEIVSILQAVYFFIESPRNLLVSMRDVSLRSGCCFSCVSGCVAISHFASVGVILAFEDTGFPYVVFYGNTTASFAVQLKRRHPVRP